MCRGGEERGREGGNVCVGEGRRGEGEGRRGEGEGAMLLVRGRGGGIRMR